LSNNAIIAMVRTVAPEIMHFYDLQKLINVFKGCKDKDVDMDRYRFNTSTPVITSQQSIACLASTADRASKGDISRSNHSILASPVCPSGNKNTQEHNQVAEAKHQTLPSDTTRAAV
jgi:hypothetical protein